MPMKPWFAGALLLASTPWASPTSGRDLPYPSLSLVEEVLLTTAKLEFSGHSQSFEAAALWSKEKLRTSRDGLRAPHLACAQYGEGREAVSRLKSFLPPGAVRPVIHSSTHGACFITTTSHTEAAVISENPARFNLESIGPFPSALKIAPGLLEHGYHGSSAARSASGRLATTHGSSMRLNNIQGLTVELSPGTLPANDNEADEYTSSLLQDLMSDSMDLHAGNFWSDPAMLEGEHLTTSGGALRGVEWSRAATVVHELSAAAKTTPGDICSWGTVTMHHAANDVLLVSGLDHLLYLGRGAGGQHDEAAELHVACFMGLLSFLAGRPEVLRVSSWQTKSLLNAAARANIQSATVTSTPLTDAGLDGTGEVIQIVDSGLNETSCYFADGDGENVKHGHYFEAVGSTNSLFSYSSESQSMFEKVFDGGDFSFDSGKRKVIQYINLVKPDDGSGPSATTTSGGARFPFVDTWEFEQDDALGHGSHTAGTVAGATLNSPAEPVTCGDGKVLGCVGGCISGNGSVSDDGTEPIDLLCPRFDCAGGEEKQCLSDDVREVLTAHGGMAQGAKLAVFDMFFGHYSYGDLAGNGLWEACLGTGCKIHSNSYGIDSRCELSAMDLMYDEFMYENPENLIIFAAGNDGEYTDRTVCTANSPAIAKNVLAIGATASGETRLTTTGEDGRMLKPTNGFADMNTMAVFSSYGPTQDGRIKPEVVAPGDQVYSATGDASGAYSCKLSAYDGTSMSCAVGAGAAAMVRQYFTDSSFYAADVKARGFCDSGFICDGFSPSSATVKAMLINSANLMGGGSEPSNFRGFGRIHLEAGMPLNGNGNMALFVADAKDTSTKEDTKTGYLFDVDASAGLDLRATLSWIDPAASSMSATQLINDLDLRVISPSGRKYTMWSENERDRVNVNERVIVGAKDVTESGTWSVRVRSRKFGTETQSYSLVVTGAISPGTGEAPKVKRHSSAASDNAVASSPVEEGQISEEDEDSSAAPRAAGAQVPLLMSLLLAAAAAMLAAATAGAAHTK